MSDNRISIIIPTYNEEENIEQLLSAIKQRQTGYVAEVIIADGFSEDSTVDIAKKCGAMVHICNHTGRGPQMNEGANLAKNPVLYFLHADSIPPPGFDSMIIHSLKSGSSAGCFRLRFDDDHPLLKFYAWFTRFSLTVFRFGDQSLFCEKRIFQEIGGFDESLAVLEDQDIVKRLKKKSAFKIIDHEVETSARKYRDNGVIWLQVVFTIIVSGYYLGVKQSTLAHLYKSLVEF